jgi:histidinol-phosphate aminotransferase
MRFSHPGLADPEFYVPGLPADHVTARYGVSPADIAKLGSAENPLGASPLAVEAIRERLDHVHLYPSWTAQPLREKISLVYAFEPERVMCGAGETEIISWLIRAFCEPGGRIQMPGPCFPIYHLFAEAEGRVPVLVHEATDRSTMAVDIDAYIDAIDDDTRIVFVTNPHSPSGTWMTEHDVRRITEAAAGALVVLDEAYVHYSGTDGYIHLVDDYPNLVVLRTFSKAFGLAGLRVGFGVGPAAVIDACLAVKPTWNMGVLQTAGAAAALDDKDHVKAAVDVIVEGRAHVQARFDGLDRFRMVPGSRANFFLVEILDPSTDSTEVFERLLERGVIVKDGSVSFRGLHKRFLRCDTNLPELMDRLVDALADLP